MYSFPRVLAAIDGTHIHIKAPTDDEAAFVNRKQRHSLNVQVLGIVYNYSNRNKDNNNE